MAAPHSVCNVNCAVVFRSMFPTPVTGVIVGPSEVNVSCLDETFKTQGGSGCCSRRLQGNHHYLNVFQTHHTKSPPCSGLTINFQLVKEMQCSYMTTAKGRTVETSGPRTAIVVLPWVYISCCWAYQVRSVWNTSS